MTLGFSQCFWSLTNVEVRKIADYFFFLSHRSLILMFPPRDPKMGPEFLSLRISLLLFGMNFFIMLMEKMKDFVLVLCTFKFCWRGKSRDNGWSLRSVFRIMSKISRYYCWCCHFFGEGRCSKVMFWCLEYFLYCGWIVEDLKQDIYLWKWQTFP